MDAKLTLESYVPSCEQELNDRRLMLSILERGDEVFLRSSELAHFTASSWIVNTDRSRVLLVYHNLYDSWSWTGGHADGEHDLLTVALREAQEETGLARVQPVTESLFSTEILTVKAHIKRGKYVAPHLHLNLTYLLEADEDQPLISKPDENSAVRWFALDEVIPASSEPEMHPIYRKLNEKLAALR